MPPTITITPINILMLPIALPRSGAVIRHPVKVQATDMESGSTSRAQVLPEVICYCADRNILALTGRALNDFHPIFGNFLADVDTKGDTYQVGVFELHPRPFVTIVQQDSVAGTFELLGNRLGRGSELLVGHVRGGHNDLEWRDLRRQPEAIVVVALLDGSREN